MFMLAMRSGLRAGDILNLKLSDIDWKNAEASIMQKKTGAFVTLPLAEETLSRRTLGTRMLESEVPVTTIMQVLGHKDPDSSKPYLSMSEKKLAECPLNLQGIAVTAEALL